jgi:hypothetical protein
MAANSGHLLLVADNLQYNLQRKSLRQEQVFVGWLEVTFKIGLSHPLMAMHAASTPISVTFPETGNTVLLEPPGNIPNEEPRLGAFDLLILSVRRECTDAEGREAALAELRKWRVLSDAAKVLWYFFEAVRESDFREHNSLAGYPVAPAEEIQNNSLVRTCDVESSYEGGPSRLIPLSSIPSIRITERAWKEAARRLASQERVLPHWSFALDAAFFSGSDPIRAVIMACAAWETALRYYLGNVASLRDPAYLVASRGGNLPRLQEFMKAAKGGDLFYDRYGRGLDGFLDRQREYVRELPTLRNKLLHEGQTVSKDFGAVDVVLAVLNAIEWLFD